MARDLGVPINESGDYYFISYNSDDADRVSIIVKQLHEYHFPMWYDKGISYGEEWEAVISEKICNCQAMVLFLTKNTFLKNKSYVFKEYTIAKSRKVNTIFVLLDDIDVVDVPSNMTYLYADINELHNIKASLFNDKKTLAYEIIKAADYRKDTVYQNTYRKETGNRVSLPVKVKRYLILIPVVVAVIGCIVTFKQVFDFSIQTVNGKKPIYLEIIAGKHANAYMFSDQMISSTRELIKRSVEESFDGDSRERIVRANVSIIVNDGNPSIETVDESILSVRTPSKASMKVAKESIIDNLIDNM